MDIRKSIKNFLAQVCARDYAQANKSLNQIVEAKATKQIEEVIDKKDTKKSASKKPTSKKSDPKKPVSAKQAAFLKKIGATKKVSKKGNK
jgi:hypothetical protein